MTPEQVRAKVSKNAWTELKVSGSLGENLALKEKIKAEDWNEIRLVVKGNRLQHYVNGVLMSDVTDNDTVNGKSKGHLGVQVHVGPPMKVQYRNIRIKNL
jgi:LEA14-like dessication related protein